MIFNYEIPLANNQRSKGESGLTIIRYCEGANCPNYLETVGLLTISLAPAL